MILLSVLGAIGIIYIMVTQMSSDALFTAQYYGKIAFKEQAYYVSRSAYAGVSELFLLDDSSYDWLQDEWAKDILPVQIPGQSISIGVKIVDLERYFDVNSIIDEDEVDEKHFAQFQRLLDELMIEKNLGNAVLDWIDADTERRLPMGADGNDYDAQMPAKGGSLDSLDELKLVKGITKEYFEGRVYNGRDVPGLKDVLALKTSGKININTAGKYVLKSLDDEMTDDLVAEIIDKRSGEPFRQIDDLEDLSGMNSDLLYRIKQLADVKSSTFKFTITVQDYDKMESADLVVIKSRSGSSGSIMYWQAD